MTRSELMSRVRGKGNRSTELALASILRRRHLTGWRRHVRVLGIDVDFVFAKDRIAVFTDGCFWHACPRHCAVEKLAPYWRDKVLGNKRRDFRQTDLLYANDWKVVRIWEHDLKGTI